MAKDIQFGDGVRRDILVGVRTLADSVGVTLGPRGRNVIIEHRAHGLPPVATKDGVTVAQAIELPGRRESIGVSMVRSMATTVSREAGDGTTTAVVLTRRIAEDTRKALASGMNPRELTLGIERAMRAVDEELVRQARPCTERNRLSHVATIASGGEEDIGEIVADALEQAGAGGVISAELGEGVCDEIECVDGMRWEQGYRSPYFMTDSKRQLAELQDAYVLIYDRVINDFSELIPTLEIVRETGGSLLVVAENFEESALPGLLLNHVRKNLLSIAVKGPGFGDSRYDYLLDLAALTGARPIMESFGEDLSSVTRTHLGKARRVVASEDATIVIGAGGDPEAIADRLARARRELDWIVNGDRSKGSPSGKRREVEKLEERISALTGKMMTIKVGGYSDVLIKERLQRVDNALNSARMARKQGVVAGGGVALYRARRALEHLTGEGLDQNHGVAIVRDALDEPLRRIAANAGLDANELLFELRRGDSDFFGFDVRRGQWGDMYEMGVIDPVGVTRLALRNAVGTATSLMMVECAVTILPPDDPTFGFNGGAAAATREDPRC
ncbi:molecular chaperone GroEL [Methylocystis sp. FS]|uniref:Hsp60 family chaperonin n=1 Tax=Methylocystis silviterrae TaxID=2743612 RepID=UPI001581CED2|nr:molecular chaperone GroEL [Methylocystis silviterrae]NUJ80673.1 molecular chaperone GroEL [Methylocystis silviterrae]